MNENLNLVKILKDCPRDWKLYSPIFGEVLFANIIHDDYPIVVELSDTLYKNFMADGKISDKYDGECMLFPSKTQRDWSKFTAPWHKKEKFDPKTFKPFDKVLVRNYSVSDWQCGFFSHPHFENQYFVGNDGYEFCIPYNDDTKHLAGTDEEAPEYYKYWEE